MSDARSPKDSKKIQETDSWYICVQCLWLKQRYLYYEYLNPQIMPLRFLCYMCWIVICQDKLKKKVQLETFNPVPLAIFPGCLRVRFAAWYFCRITPCGESQLWAILSSNCESFNAASGSRGSGGSRSNTNRTVQFLFSPTCEARRVRLQSRERLKQQDH